MQEDEGTKPSASLAKLEIQTNAELRDFQMAAVGYFQCQVIYFVGSCIHCSRSSKLLKTYSSGIWWIRYTTTTT